MPDVRTARAITIAYFANDIGDAAVQRRAWSFLDAGVQVLGLMYRRDASADPTRTAWRNIDLGLIEHGHLGKRLFHGIRAAVKMLTERQRLKSADILYARNLDLLFIAALALLVIRFDKRPRIVYEVLDVHASMTDQGMLSKMYRALERLALLKVDMLVVSAPAFITEYFEGVQEYGGKHALLENKIHFGGSPITRPKPAITDQPGTGPLVIAWVGNIRCQVTLELLKALAAALADNVLIRCSGVIRCQTLPNFQEQIAGCPNIVYEGPYSFPCGLVDAYRGAHFVWSHDMNGPGANTDWLLPNRIYEGSYFGVLSLAVSGTETARVVTERNLGYVLPDAASDTLIEFIKNVSREEIARKQRLLLARAASEFISSKQETEELIETLVTGRKPQDNPLRVGYSGYES